MSTYTIHFQLPNLCARCGAMQEGLTPWKITAAQTSFNSASLFTVLLGIVVTDTQRSTFHVPVCATCREKLAQHRKREIYLRLGLILEIIAFFALLLLARDVFNTTILGMSVGLIIGILAVANFVALWLYGRNSLASYDGSFFKFGNDVFQRQFMKLNPELVDPQAHEQEKHFR